MSGYVALAGVTLVAGVMVGALVWRAAYGNAGFDGAAAAQRPYETRQCNGFMK
jgi:hypothetical protein